jgi:hypothetical protein
MFRTRVSLTSVFSGLIFGALALGVASPAGADDDFGVGATSKAFAIEVNDVTAKVGEPTVLRAKLKIQDGYKILKHYNNRVVSLSSADDGVAFEDKMVPATVEDDALVFEIPLHATKPGKHPINGVMRVGSFSGTGEIEMWTQSLRLIANVTGTE